MIVRCTLIQNGAVVNVIMADPAEYQPEGFIVLPSDTANIGDSYVDGVIVPVPQEVEGD